MESVFRKCNTRRFADRREASSAYALADRRVAERRVGIKRGQHTPWSASRLVELLPAIARPLFVRSDKAGHIFIPLWALFCVFAITFVSLMANIDTKPIEASHSQHQHATREIIIIDPSEAMTIDIARSGYVVLETLTMKELDIRVQRLKIPATITLSDALIDLRDRFPGIEVDANSQLRTIQ